MEFTIKVPATSANIGLGFDSLGIAVNLYLTLQVKEASSEWMISHPFGEEIPTNEENLIIETALNVCPTLTPHKLVCESEIPLTRGLGSSSSAIVAGIELANVLGNLQLTNHEKVKWSTLFEGHPDNVAPAILGGVVVATYDHRTQEVLTVHKNVEAPIAMVAVIPNVQLSTKKSRGVLPSSLEYGEAVEASSRSNVLVAGLMTEDWKVISSIVEKDLFHETYRSTLVPWMEEVRTITKQEGLDTCGTYLSGAGPTVMTFVYKENVDRFVQTLEHYLETTLKGCTIRVLEIDAQGVRVN